MQGPLGEQLGQVISCHSILDDLSLQKTERRDPHPIGKMGIKTSCVTGKLKTLNPQSIMNIDT